MAIVEAGADNGGVGRYLGGTGAIGNGHQRVGLYTDFIPKVLVDERLERLGASLDDERLDAVGMETLEVQGMGMVDDEALGVWALPITDIQLGLISFIRHTAYEDGILLGTELMGEHPGEVAGYLGGREVIVDEAIGRLGPFQDDEGALFAMECEETTIQRLAFLLENTHLDLDACLANLTDATTLHLGKLIDAAYDDATHTFLYNKVGTGRRLAIVRTGLQRDVDGGLRQQVFILLSHGGKGIHLGMALATTHMIALADNPAISHNHSPYHRVGLRILLAILRQLDAATHEFFVLSHKNS